MNEERHHDSGDLDSSSDPTFFSYYEKQSLAPATLERVSTAGPPGPGVSGWVA